MKSYRVAWSEDDREWVATCDQFPSLSYLHELPTSALDGLLDLVQVVELDMKEELAELEAKGGRVKR